MNASGSGADPSVRWLFAGTVGLGAALLFGVQPVAARALLPVFGGSASVWTLCLVFFQGALLLGYGWAHLSLRRLGERRQAVVQLLALLLPVLWPVSAAALGSEPSLGSPVGSLLGALGRSVGPVFVVLATTSPVLSRWYAARGGQGAGGAYALYAASNAGSLGSLLAYPLLAEPLLSVTTQFALLRWGYGLYAVAVVACAVSLWRHPAPVAAGLASGASPHATAADEPASGVLARDGAGPAPGWRRRLSWVGLAAVPASLLSSLTVYLTTDIASLPLLWVLPLALYLASFIVIYRERPLLTVAQSARLLPLPLLVLTLLVMARAMGPAALLVAVGLAVTFLGATLAHGLLYDDRPGPERLTEFYLLSSLGGALGGAFNALLAPRLFTDLDELPLGLLAVAALRGLVVAAPTASSRGRDLARAALLVAAGGLGLRLSQGLGAGRPVALLLLFSAVSVVVYRDLPWPRRFALGLGALALTGKLFSFEDDRQLFAGRSFFGTVVVREDPDGQRSFSHGNTLHGIQRTRGADRGVPTSYYHPQGPLGDLVRAWQAGGGQGRVGVVGLGAGAMAAYARSGEPWVFYELDPLVGRVAGDPTLFTYLSDARERGAPIDVRFGDARLQLPREPDASFGLLALDAFSSDSIPLHLVTREALALYRRVTRADGLVALHVSNRYLDLPPVLAATAAELGLTLRCRSNRRVREQDTSGRSPSHWCVLLPPGSPVALDATRWRTPVPARRSWTDGRASLLEALSWQGVSR